MINGKIHPNRKRNIAVLVLLLIAVTLIILSMREKENVLKNPNLDPLTPKQVVEYIGIFYLECDKTTEQNLAGESYTLTATEETADLLIRINFFTNELHSEGTRYNKVGEKTTIFEYSSKEFYDAYL